jgi:AcrR family transcriptional regulator
VPQRGAAPGAGSLSAEDWVRAAAGAIAEGGVGAVAVEPLAARLGVTKGSFYWHFKSRRALLEATVERWEAEETEAVISATSRVADPRERLVQVFDAATSDEPRDGGHAPASGVTYSRAFELGIADAVDDPVVGPVLRRVSERRVDYLEECYCALGLGPEEARHRSLLAYAAYVGFLRLTREAPSRTPRGDAYLAYRRHLLATLVPS